MSEPSQIKGIPAWFMGGVLALLALLVGLTWINGAMLNRQQHQLVAMREEIQGLAEGIEQGLSEGDVESSLAPVAVPRRVHARHFLRVQQQEDGSDQGMKDLKESRDSAKKAVQEARDVQRKVSFEENARLADEKAKLDAAEHHWRPWLYLAVGLGVLAMLVRAWIRRRG